MTRLYSNENFPKPAVEELRRLGHDVLTSFEAGQANRGVPDDAVLRFATAEGRAVVTLNRRDFARLHRSEGVVHAGIVLPGDDTDFCAMANRIHEGLKEHNPLAGKLMRVSKGGVKIDNPA